MLLTASLLIFRSIDYRMVIKPMKVESTTQAMCDLALRLSEGDEESMVITNDQIRISSFFHISWLYD